MDWRYALTLNQQAPRRLELLGRFVSDYVVMRCPHRRSQSRAVVVRQRRLVLLESSQQRLEVHRLSAWHAAGMLDDVGGPGSYVRRTLAQQWCIGGGCISAAPATDIRCRSHRGEVHMIAVMSEIRATARDFDSPSTS